MMYEVRSPVFRSHDCSKCDEGGVPPTERSDYHSISEKFKLLETAYGVVQRILCHAVEDSQMKVKRDLDNFWIVIAETRRNLSLVRRILRHNFEIMASDTTATLKGVQAMIGNEADWMSDHEECNDIVGVILRSAIGDGPFHSTLKKEEIISPIPKSTYNYTERDSHKIERNDFGYLPKANIGDVIGPDGNFLGKTQSITQPIRKVTSGETLNVISHQKSSTLRTSSTPSLKISQKCSVLLDDGLSNPLSLSASTVEKKISDIHMNNIHLFSRSEISDNRSIGTRRKSLRTTIDNRDILRSIKKPPITTRKQPLISNNTPYNLVKGAFRNGVNDEPIIKKLNTTQLYTVSPNTESHHYFPESTSGIIRNQESIDSRIKPNSTKISNATDLQGLQINRSVSGQANKYHDDKSSVCYTNSAIPSSPKLLINPKHVLNNPKISHIDPEFESKLRNPLNLGVRRDSTLAHHVGQITPPFGNISTTPVLSDVPTNQKKSHFSRVFPLSPEESPKPKTDHKSPLTNDSTPRWVRRMAANPYFRKPTDNDD